MLKKLACSLVALSFASIGTTARAQYYTGHDSTPRLRGVNMTWATSPSDFPTLSAWGGNLVRYELIYSSQNGAYPAYSSSDDADFTHGNGTNPANPTSDITSSELADYHAWLQWEVTNSSSDLNTCLRYCASNNIKVLIDLHLSAGGSLTSGTNRIFDYNDCYQEFLSDWGMIAQTYASNSAVWGYDLCNEPNQGGYTLTDWNHAALAAAQQIRQYDNAGGSNPAHTIVMEIAGTSANPLGSFTDITPLTSVAGVVYSFHTYGIGTYYEQDDASDGTAVWPDPTPDDNIDGGPNGSGYNFQRHDLTSFYWSGACHIQDARDFQLTNHCQIFVGEFGTFRWAPGSPEFCNEIIQYCESYGWDWTTIGFRDDATNVWTGFDLDLGPDGTHQVSGQIPYVPKTDLKTLFTAWFANDASPVSNFNFLTPSAGTGSQAILRNPNASPWTMYNSTGIAGNGSDFYNPNSATGNQCAYLQTNSGSGLPIISQAIQWMPGTPYVVSFNAARRPAFNTQTLYVYVGGTISNNTLSGGTLVGSFTPSATDWDNYATPPFTVGQGSLPVTQLLSFVGGSSTGDQTDFIDTVSVLKQPPSTLPLGTAWLAGTPITDSSDTALAAASVVDNNVTTYFNSTQASGGWVGIDLGSGKTATLSHVYYYPRSDDVPLGNPQGNVESAMQGGQFQGSNDKSTWVTLATVDNSVQYGQEYGSRADAWCQLAVTKTTTAYRYFRYLGPSGAHCNVSEVRYYGESAALINDGSESGAAKPPQQAFDANYLTSFESVPSNTGWTGIDLGSGNTGIVNQFSFYPDVPSQMVGGVFQGSNNKSTWTTLATISGTPAASQWTTLYIPTPNPNASPAVPYPNPYRYFRYYNANTVTSSVNEIQLYGDTSHLLTGTNINDAWGANWGNPPTNAYDGNTTTCYDSNLGKGGWTGIDVGAANPAVVTSISYYPDSAWSGGPSQMIGGVFQGSNDGSTWTNLTTQITTAPTISVWTTVVLTNTKPYRYLRYYDNGSGSNWCDVAEVKFYGY